MKTRRYTRLLLLVGLLLAGWKVWTLVEDDPLLTLLFFIVAGAAAGLGFVKGVLPWMADALGTSIFLSGEKLEGKEDDAAAEEETEEEPESTEDRRDA